MSLVSWAELKRAGWKVDDESLTCIWHPREKVTVYFEAKHGLLYLPIERCDAHDDAHDDNEEINVAPTGFLSNLMKNYITFRRAGHDKITQNRRAEWAAARRRGTEAPDSRIRYGEATTRLPEEERRALRITNRSNALSGTCSVHFGLLLSGAVDFRMTQLISQLVHDSFIR